MTRRSRNIIRLKAHVVIEQQEGSIVVDVVSIDWPNVELRKAISHRTEILIIEIHICNTR